MSPYIRTGASPLGMPVLSRVEGGASSAVGWVTVRSLGVASPDWGTNTRTDRRPPGGSSGAGSLGRWAQAHPGPLGHPSQEGIFCSPLGRGGRRPGWVPFRITRPERGYGKTSRETFRPSHRRTGSRLHGVIPADEVVPGRVELKRAAMMRGLQADKQHDVGD